MKSKFFYLQTSWMGLRFEIRDADGALVCFVKSEETAKTITAALNREPSNYWAFLIGPAIVAAVLAWAYCRLMR